MRPVTGGATHLGTCDLGTAVRVVAVDLAAGPALRLAELGLRPGALLHVVQVAGHGGRVVAVGADRFAVDAHGCAAVRVEPACRVPVPA